jgi:biopolymer transport protein ExbB
MDVFRAVQDSGLNTHVGQLSGGILQALVCTAAGLAVSIPSYAGYNYLVSRVNTIVLDMEQVSSEILNIVTVTPEAAPRLP